MFIGFLLSLILPTLVAYLLFRSFLLSLGFSLLAIFGISYFIGLGLITQAFTLFWIFGIPITLLSGSTCLAFLSGVAFFLPRFSDSKEIQTSDVNISRFEKFFILGTILYVSFNLVIVFLNAVVLPVYAWDSISSEAYKAKTIFFTGSLTQLAQAIYPNFPFYTLSAMTWTMFGQGVWDDRYIHLIFAFALMFYTLVFFDMVRLLTSRLESFLAILLLFSSNLLVMHSTLSYRDILMMAHTSLCVLGIVLWGARGVDGYILFAAFFAGLSLLTKLEGLPYYLVYVTLILVTGYVYRKKIKDIFVVLMRFIAISGLMYLPFQVFKFVISAGDRGWAAAVVCPESFLTRLSMILGRFFNELFLWGNWNVFFWPIFTVSTIILLVVYQKDRISLISLGAVLMFFGVYFATFLLTGSFAAMRTPYTISRYLMHFFPLAIFLIVRILYLARKDHVQQT
ncbi:MAG: hypothetical protein HQL22_03070 [Candidatus Omnitrophica bacterium]|nr:hypothetical protein [Candidatus Omnitrophota bacterium]